MTPRQVELVQTSFARVLPVADAAAEVLYNRLFELDPSLRSLFKSDMKQQGKNLMDSLKMVVDNLRNLDSIIPGMQAMALRHKSYGVKSEHYLAIGVALIDTLRKGLGHAFTSEVRDAWVAAYTTLAVTMQAA